MHTILITVQNNQIYQLPVGGLNSKLPSYYLWSLHPLANPSVHSSWNISQHEGSKNTNKSFMHGMRHINSMKYTNKNNRSYPAPIIICRRSGPNKLSIIPRCSKFSLSKHSKTCPKVPAIILPYGFNSSIELTMMGLWIVNLKVYGIQKVSVSY